MYSTYKTHPCFNCMYSPNNMNNIYQCPYYTNAMMYNPNFVRQFDEQFIPFSDEIDNDAKFNFFRLDDDNPSIKLKDYGPEPFIVNIEEATKENNTFRTALWTGKHLQLTLMSINVGEDIGLEIHPNVDQFIRIEEGQGLAQIGDRKDNLSFQAKVSDDYAIIIPAGKWHNIINTGDKPLKLYSIYAPPEHPHGTVHQTKADAEAHE